MTVPEYKAAGIALYKVERGKLFILLGQENPKRRRKSRVWNFLGGKRERRDASVRHTAAREFCEEANIEDIPDFADRLRNAKHCWLHRCKYTLYFLPANKNETRMDMAFNLASQDVRLTREMLRLKWVEFNRIKSLRGKSIVLAIGVRKLVPLVPTLKK